MKLIKLDNSLIEKIIYPEFQRKLRLDRVSSIANYGISGKFIPPILLGNTGNSLILIDGQHRLEARKKNNFDLHAIIQETDIEKAQQEFVDISTHSIRISLKHRLKFDNSPTARIIRNYAELFKCEINQVYAIYSGLSGDFGASYNKPFKKDVMIKVKKILSVWTKDRRFYMRNQIYSKSGVLKMIGSLSKRASDLNTLLGKLKDIDYSNKSPLSFRYGSSGTTQRLMKEYCLKYII